MGRSRKQGAASSQLPGEAAFDEAETLQHRGGRKKGQEAFVCFDLAVAKFQEALHVGLPQDKVSDAYFGLAECSTYQAEAIMHSSSALPDTDASLAGEHASMALAASLYERAVQMYKKVPREADVAGGALSSSAAAGVAVPPMRVDAAVNCGNTLTALAELLVDLPQIQSSASPEALLLEARASYAAALTEEDDAGTHSNLGDTLVQHAQLLWALGRASEAEAVAQLAVQEYQTACSMTSSEDGDDLPGLLCNWGQGLHAIAVKLQDPASREHLLQEACQRLQQAADFQRADTVPMNALGDVLMSKAEGMISAASLFLPEAHSPMDGARLAAAQAVLATLQSALDLGYSLAQRINRNNMEAMVGTAEVHAAAGKVAHAMGDSAAAADHWGRSLSNFEAALTRPDLIGKFTERCVVRYNAALVLAAVGREQEAAALLAGLLATGTTTVAELAAEADLARFHSAQWFRSLLDSHGSTS